MYIGSRCIYVKVVWGKKNSIDKAYLVVGIVQPKMFFLGRI